MKIDIFPHILTKNYWKAFCKRVKVGLDTYSMSGYDLSANLGLSDIDVRLRVMDRFPDVIHVLNEALPPLETTLVSPKDAVELAKLANDEMAELVAKYPDKFLTAVACLPMNDIDAAIKEAERAINHLKFRGVQIFSNMNGEPLDEPKFKPLYERMAKYDLPIWIHPWWSSHIGQSEQRKFPESQRDMMGRVFWALGWPWETTLAMIRLAESNVFIDYPNIKFITHHCGGMASFYANRIRNENMRKFYNDTAVYGKTAPLMCGYDFFGPEHLLFGTDMPFGLGETYGCTEDTIQSIEQMNIPDLEKDKIFGQNAKRLLKLSL